MATTRERWLSVEVRHLAALEAIANEGSFHGAADSLGYVQSAISQQVAQLEQLSGARLLERSRGSAPVSFTDAGQLLLGHVEAILGRLQSAYDDISAMTAGQTGTVRVGALESVAARVFPHVLPNFARQSPGVRVQPTESQSDAPLFAMLERGEIHLAACELPPLDGPFEYVELMVDPFVLVVSVDSPLAALDEAPPLEELVQMPMIAFHTSRGQQALLNALVERGLEPRITHRSDLNATVQALVAAELGIAIVPFLCVDPLHPGTAAFDLPGLPPRRIGLAWHAERQRPRAVELFVDAVVETCAQRFRRRG